MAYIEGDPDRDSLGSIKGVNSTDGGEEDQPPTEEEIRERFWLDLARSAYNSSTHWLDSSLRTQWEKNTAHFQNRFPNGSKYHSDAYRRRSRVFRPKIRPSVRANEAGMAAAMFSTKEMASVTPVNDKRPESRASAAVIGNLLQHRLEHDIPWFLTVQGAFQDSQVIGRCASYQYWHYEERQEERYIYGPAGQPVFDEDGKPAKEVKTVMVKDKPCVDLLPLENIRFDPAADWRDPIGTSPYVIRMVPMYASEVKDRMREDLPGQQKWRDYTMGEIRSLGGLDNDATRKEREHDRADPHDSQRPSQFKIVWCLEHYIRLGGEEYVFWTLGTRALLSEPQFLSEVYFHGERPVTLGTSIVEAHKPYPSSPVELGEGLQEATNDIQNQRFDNVQLVLNKRYFLRRGAKIDVQALMRNTPGGAVVTTDPEKDVNVISTQDITSSSYSEQDRIDVQLDEMMGNFSQSSVNNNRNLNETVGGMQMMSGAASSISEYAIRTFVETWVEPVLRQLILLEQYYETDQVLMQMAAEEAQVFERFGVNEITDEMLMRKMSVTVNVGIGATNPEQKVNRFLTGMNAAASIPGVVEDINGQEIIKEIFGALGYKDGMRFFTPQEQKERAPTPAEIEAQEKQADREARMQIEHAKLADRTQEWQTRVRSEYELRMADIAAREGMTIAQLEAKLLSEERREALEREKNQTKRDVAALTATNHQNEMELKRRTGSGI